jgi:hypothetical protein
MWGAAGETTGIFEKFRSERRPRYGVTLASQARCSGPLISDPTALPLFPLAR